jgi:hypothetical protein
MLLVLKESFFTYRASRRAAGTGSGRDELLWTDFNLWSSWSGLPLEKLAMPWMVKKLVPIPGTIQIKGLPILTAVYAYIGERR